MKAIVVHQYGGPDVLKLEDYPDPVPGPGEVLVRVAAASVNPIRLQKTATSEQALFDQITELYPHWVANQSWLMFGFPGA